MRPATLSGLASANFSTVIESDALVVVDRTMTWGSGYGSHAETALTAPVDDVVSRRGLDVGRLQPVLPAAEPERDAGAGDGALSAAGRAAAGREDLHAARRTAARRSTSNAEGPALASTDVSAVITADAPIIVERAMYVNKPGQPFAAGHESAGVTAPALNWFLAEGATGPVLRPVRADREPERHAGAGDRGVSAARRRRPDQDLHGAGRTAASRSTWTPRRSRRDRASGR